MQILATFLNDFNSHTQILKTFENKKKQLRVRVRGNSDKKQKENKKIIKTYI